MKLMLFGPELYFLLGSLLLFLVSLGKERVGLAKNTTIGLPLLELSYLLPPFVRKANYFTMPTGWICFRSFLRWQLP